MPIASIIARRCVRDVCRAAVLCFVFYSLVVARGLAAEAGVAIFVAGKVSRVTVSGEKQTLETGSHLQIGDRLETGPGGFLYIKTVDSGFLVLRPLSEAIIAQYAFDAVAPEESAIRLELRQGVARFISGIGAQKARERFRFNTPVAAIGIRGTDFSVWTDSSTSRVSVRSGGVVMGRLGAACSATGWVCEGAAVQELFAGREAMLQVHAGQEKPELIQFKANPKARDLLPDKLVPPALFEDDSVLRTRQVPSGSESKNANSALSFAASEAARNAAQLVMEKTVSLAAEKDTPTITADPTTPAIRWGRWAPIAGNPASTDTDAVLKSGELLAMQLPVFYVVRDSTSGNPPLPTSGTASFRLLGGESYIQYPNDVKAAAVSNAKLSVNFADRSFATSLNVSDGVTSTQVSAAGAVSSRGTFVRDVLNSNATLQGGLAGANWDQAGYTYSRSVGKGVSAIGVTYWAK